MNKAAWILGCLAALGLAAVPVPAFAQDSYPSLPVRLVLGFPPGATTDAVARLLAQKLSAQLNVNFIVDNKPGANGNIGAEFVVKSRPDGHTLLFNTGSVILSPALGEKVNYDVFKDLTPVALVATAPQLLVVHPSVPANTVAEFIAHLRANPGKLAYGSGGTGNITHLAALLFLQANGLTALHVPYKGTGDAVIDLMAGRLQFTIQATTTVLPLVRDKHLRALAYAGLKRLPLLPDVPTLAETVMPGFEAGSVFGVMAPAKTPAEIVRRINGEILKTLQEPEVKVRLAQEGAEPLGSSPEEYGAYLRREFERWTKVIRSAGINAN